MNKRIFFAIFPPLIVLFYLIVSCQNPAAKPVRPAEDKPRPEGSYTVRFNANGGTGEMEASVFPAFPSGVWKNLPANTFTRKNYVFIGWAISADEPVKYADKASVYDLASAGKTVTLYAKWGTDVYYFI